MSNPLLNLQIKHRMFFTIIIWKQANPPYKFKWTEKTIPVAEGSSETTTEGYMENYKNVSQDIVDVDACPNACEMWKSIKRLKQGKSINVQDSEIQFNYEIGKFTITGMVLHLELVLLKNCMVAEEDEMSKEKRKVIKLMALIFLSFKKIYKPTNNNLKTSSNIGRANQDNSPRINRGFGYDNQRVVNVSGARENVGHLEQPESVNDTYPVEQDEHNIIIDSLDIFHDMIEESIEVFMDDFSVFGDSFDKCLNNLDKMPKQPR
ncbi:hypothetical protein Tco_0415372 [Tanacetum coccineum]